MCRITKKTLKLKTHISKPNKNKSLEYIVKFCCVKYIKKVNFSKLKYLIKEQREVEDFKMGLASNQARLNVLTLRKADLEARLLTLSNQTQRIATEQAQAIADKSNAITTYIANSADQTVSFENTKAYMDYETAMSKLEIAQNKLDQQQKTAETELKAVQNEQEQVKKLVETNAKKSFAYFN